METKPTKLEVPAGAGRNQKNFFEKVTDLSEKEDVSLTTAIKDIIQKDPRVFASYLVEIGVLTAEQAAEFGRSGRL